LYNSSTEALRRIERIVKKSVSFEQVDLTEYEALDEAFSKYTIDSVIHFAALKAVGESGQIPLEYWRNNVGGTINLLRVMQKHGVKQIVFSSSATVYGDVTRFEGMIPIPGKQSLALS
jgi:UDP-glucose 4-epimerase